jgi:hypothetical protein
VQVANHDESARGVPAFELEVAALLDTGLVPVDAAVEAVDLDLVAASMAERPACCLARGRQPKLVKVGECALRDPDAAGQRPAWGLKSLR